MKYPSPISFHTMKPSEPENLAKPTDKDMRKVFALCRDNHWNEILDRIQTNPFIALTPMIMVNYITSTVLHQAIISRGAADQRAAVMRQILSMTPQAAAIRNGYGSLPLHVIAQRNTKMPSRVKEEMIRLLIKAHPQALAEPGGVGRRTPLHIIFTDYISPRLTQDMIDHGEAACAMTDKKGWLPAHVACSRHCSPEKLHMILKPYPEALHAVTEDGHTLLSLAKSTATDSHPNYALIDMLQREVERSIRGIITGCYSPPRLIASPTTTASPPNIATAISLEISPSPLSCQARGGGLQSEVGAIKNHRVSLCDSAPASPGMTADAAFATPRRATKARGPRPASKRSYQQMYESTPKTPGTGVDAAIPAPKRAAKASRFRPACKGSYQQLYEDPVGLLLHLSQPKKEGDIEQV